MIPRVATGGENKHEGIALTAARSRTTVHDDIVAESEYIYSTIGGVPSNDESDVLLDGEDGVGNRPTVVKRTSFLRFLVALGAGLIGFVLLAAVLLGLSYLVLMWTNIDGSQVN